jgi:VanZ family protein
MSTARRWAPSLLWGAVILIATSLPASTLPAPPRVPGLDKVVHLSLYAVLAFLVGQAIGTSALRTIVVAALGIAVFAAADEWHQRWIPGRGADPMDWLADLAGAMLGFILSRTALARRETRT